MTGKDIIKEIMDERGITNAQLAEHLGVTQATMWARLNTKAEKDMQLYTFYEMINAMDYEIVLRPKNERYVGGEERVAEIDALVTAKPKKRGRPRKGGSAEV